MGIRKDNVMGRLRFIRTSKKNDTSDIRPVQSITVEHNDNESVAYDSVCSDDGNLQSPKQHPAPLETNYALDKSKNSGLSPIMSGVPSDNGASSTPKCISTRSPTNGVIDKKDYRGSVSRDGTPVISGVTGEYFKASDVFQTTYQDCTTSTGDSKSHSTWSSSRKRRERRVLSEAPTAKDSAFSGPPRYDWIDIETSAAVKIQAIVRRNQIMDQLAREKKTTAAMRNRARARVNGGKKVLASEDVPVFMRFCGIGLLFGEATGEDQEVLNAQEKEIYRSKKDEAERKDARSRKLRVRRKASDQMLESVEVVEDVSESRQ